MESFFFDTLPIHPLPEQLEPFTMYLTRVAEINGIESVNGIAALCFPNTSVRVIRDLTDFPPVSFGALSLTLGASEEQLRATTLYHIGALFARSTKPQPLSRFLAGSLSSYRRFCPLCLAECGFYLLTWRFTQLIGCITHGCHLMDHCPHCKQQVPLWKTPFRSITCPFCNRKLCVEEAQMLDSQQQQEVIAWDKELRFLLTPQAKIGDERARIVAIGAYLADHRRARGWTASDLAKLLLISSSEIEGIERGSVLNRGASFLGYTRYAALFNYSLQDLFTTVYPDVIDESDKRERLQSRRRLQLREEFLLEQVMQAEQQTGVSGHSLSQQAVGDIVQMSPQGLKKYNRVKAVLQRITREATSRREQDLVQRDQVLIAQIDEAARTLQEQGKRLSQRAIAAYLGIAWSSIRSSKVVATGLRQAVQRYSSVV